MIHEPTYKGMTPPSTQNLKALRRRTHTYTGHACLKSRSGSLSIQGQTVLVQTEGETPGRSHKNENKSPTHIRE